MEQKTQNHRILHTTGEVSEPVMKLTESLETLLVSKQGKLAELFSKEETNSILKITLELVREGIVPDWSLKLSTFGTSTPVASTRIELIPAADNIRAEIMKLAAQKGLELLAQANKEESKTEPK